MLFIRGLPDTVSDILTLVSLTKLETLWWEIYGRRNQASEMPLMAIFLFTVFFIWPFPVSSCLCFSIVNVSSSFWSPTRTSAVFSTQDKHCTRNRRKNNCDMADCYLRVGTWALPSTEDMNENAFPSQCDLASKTQKRHTWFHLGFQTSCVAELSKLSCSVKERMSFFVCASKVKKFGQLWLFLI